jgi:hypothetical protein
MKSVGSQEPPDRAAPNQRPVSVTSFICENSAYDNWAFINKSKNRFFIVNLDHVLAKLNVDYTLTRGEFHRAAEIILGETNWGQE